MINLENHCCSAMRMLAALCLLLLSSAAAQSDRQPQSSPQDVLTYHGDNFRTGWFSAETQLTTSNVNAASFGLLHTVTLDGRVDAEPLVVIGQTIQGQGVHDVVYVATEQNSVYAIDAGSGAILWHSHFGIPVPDQLKSYDDNVYPVMGILSTPVIDRTAGLMYFVGDSLGGGGDLFKLHAVSLSTGLDAMSPATIEFSERLWDGTNWTFNPKYHLQRPALLEANGSVYVAFGSNGDINPDQSRGTILRYDAATLTPLTGQITNKLHLASSPYYLSSIWASGYGPATDASGDVFFTTGNSDPRRPSYYQTFNRPDSMVRLSGDLFTLKDSFTTYDYFRLDEGDVDVGSGGMLVLPDQSGSIPHLAVAGGKDGRAFLLNRDNMGGYTPGGPNRVVQTVTMGSCWCGPAYFVGADSIPRVVTGGGNGVTSWKLQTSPSVQLVQDTSTGSGPVNGLPDDGGVVPVISSSGTTAGTGIVWFVQKPSTSSDQNPGTPITLRAFAASNLQQQLVSITAGTWTHAVNSNANIVPTVAKGKVYVASNQQLRIFGLIGQDGVAQAKIAASLSPSAPTQIACPAGTAPLGGTIGASLSVHDFYGTICESGSDRMQVELRSGAVVRVQLSQNPTRGRPMLLTPGRPVHVRVTLGADGVATAQRIFPVHAISPLTPADR